jgi:hypothetical protein
MSDSEEMHSVRKIEKPFGVYVLTIFDFVAIGLVPLIAIVLVRDQPELDIPFLSFVLPLPAMVASIWAMTGDNFGRWLLLVFVTVTSILMIAGNLNSLAAGVLAGVDAIRAVGTIVRGVFWIAINWWYFNRGETVAYYKRHERRDTAYRAEQKGV